MFSGARAAVRYVKLVAKTPRSSAPGTAGEQFVDVAELQVHKTPGSKVGPTADTGAASGIGPSGATLSASVKANGGAVPDVVFEYGTTTAYGKLVAATGTTAVKAALTGLAASTRYHYRVVALRDGRRYPGADASFVTAKAPTPAATATASAAAAAGAGPLRRDHVGQGEGHPQGRVQVRRPLRRRRARGHGAGPREAGREDDRLRQGRRRARARPRRSA